jgi:hypothetical protein
MNGINAGCEKRLRPEYYRLTINHISVLEFGEKWRNIYLHHRYFSTYTNIVK